MVEKEEKEMSHKYRGFGWSHIVGEHDRDFEVFYEEKFGRGLSIEEMEKQIQRDIGEVLNNGTQVADGDIIERTYDRIHVRVARGSIQTAFPTPESGVIKHNAKVMEVEPVYGEFDSPIEGWVTYNINGINVDTFNAGFPITPEVGKDYSVSIILWESTCPHKVDGKKRLFKEITSFSAGDATMQFPKATYYVEAPIKKVMKDKKRIIVDVGFDLEIYVGENAFKDKKCRSLKEGDWISALGRVFSEILDGKKRGQRDVREKNIGRKKNSKKVEGFINRVLKLFS